MYGIDAGWSSLVARRAHNPKVGGSNPSPATTERTRISTRSPLKWGLFCFTFSFVCFRLIIFSWSYYGHTNPYLGTWFTYCIANSKLGWVYIFVVVVEAWANNFCLSSISIPDSNRLWLNVCRKLCKSAWGLLWALSLESCYCFI